MIVNVKYFKSELNAAVDFLAKNNKHFIGQHDVIKESILDTIKNIADVVKPGCTICSKGTMGYMVHLGDVVMESMDHDNNEIYVEIYVDPAVCRRDYSESDIATETVIIDYHDGEYLKST